MKKTIVVTKDGINQLKTVSRGHKRQSRRKKQRKNLFAEMIDGNDFENSQTEKLGRKQISRADPAGERLFGSTSATALTPTVSTLSDLTLPPHQQTQNLPFSFSFAISRIKTRFAPRLFHQVPFVIHVRLFSFMRCFVFHRSGPSATHPMRVSFLLLLFIALPSGAEDDVGMRERSVAFFCLYFACVNA